MDLLIKNGTLIDTVEKRISGVRNIGIKDGCVTYIGSDMTNARRVIDAEGCIVSPGFVDIHIHDENPEDSKVLETALLRQGVTTAIAGNCGDGETMEEIERNWAHPWIKMAFLTGHATLRRKVGMMDIMSPVGEDHIDSMKAMLKKEMCSGSLGLSIGLEDTPGASYDEILALAKILSRYKCRFVSIHTRYDGERCLEGVSEAVRLAKDAHIRVLISHFAGMNAYGKMDESLMLVDRAVQDGADVFIDAYPYNAFCTNIGSPSFDGEFERRWGKGLEYILALSGEYRGKKLDRITFDEIRKKAPNTLMHADVMNPEEMSRCMAHPRCAIASDSLLENGEGHPRVSGAFPKAINMLRDMGFSWPHAISRATFIPASIASLEAGIIAVGRRADIAIIDPCVFADTSTFDKQLSPAAGVRYVLIDGGVALENGEIASTPLGRLIK